MKRKIAFQDSPSPFCEMKGPPVSLEAAERLKAILRTRADNQFELDRLFSGNPKIRHQTRQKMEKLLRQSEAAETMAPSLQRDMPKTAMAVLHDDEMEILGLKEKTASKNVRNQIKLLAPKMQGIVDKLHPTQAGRDTRAYRSAASIVERKNASDWGKKGAKELGQDAKGAAQQHDLVGDLVSKGYKRQPDGSMKLASITPNVDAWFEKNAHRFHTDAQNRYPELKKVARTLPGKCTKTVGTPVRSGLAGGSA
jgi:hypothetical protein